MRLYLKPLRLDYQIIDAIEGYTPPELTKKAAACRRHHKQITHINGDPVYNVKVENQDVIYNLADRGGRFYYPIQYAGIIIKSEAIHEGD
jgi:hypothetical protein